MDRRTFGKLMTAFTLGPRTDICGAEQSDPVPLHTPPVNAFEQDTAPAEPLRIGNRKQLFLDRWIVAETDEVLFTVVPPTKHGDGPVMMPDQPADERVPYPQAMNPAGVRWNAQKQLFEMWYDAVYLAPGKERHYFAYAESENGIDWRKPQLGLRKIDGFNEGNFIDGPGGRLIFDDHETDPQRRLKAVGGGINLAHLVFAGRNALDTGIEGARVHQNWRFAYVIGMGCEASEICRLFPPEESSGACSSPHHRHLIQR